MTEKQKRDFIRLHVERNGNMLPVEADSMNRSIMQGWVIYLLNQCDKLEEALQRIAGLDENGSVGECKEISEKALKAEN